MNTLCCAFLLFLGLTLVPQSNTAPEVEITAEPSHHLALENQLVRAFQVEAPAHGSTLPHRHRHDYVFVSLGDSEISNNVVGKSPVTLKLKDGEVRFAPGNFVHVVRNLAATPFRNVTIEFLQDDKASVKKWDDERALRVLHNGTEEILFVKDGVRVSEVELQIAGVLPKHNHSGPELLVAISDLELRNDVAGKPASNIEMKSGDIKWFNGGFAHALTNVGQRGVKFVTLEF